MHSLHVSLDGGAEVEILLTYQVNETPDVLAVEVLSSLTGSAKAQFSFGTSQR